MATSVDAEQFDRVVQKIDDAEQALSQMYYLVIGRSPPWSKTFGHEEALSDVRDAMKLLKGTIKEAEQRGRPYFHYDEDACPGHVASRMDRKICGLCGVHVDSFRPDDDGER